jgi:hypothetical protein
MTNDEWRYDRVLRFTALLSLTIGRFYPEGGSMFVSLVRKCASPRELYTWLYKRARLYYALPFADRDWAHLVHVLSGLLMRLTSPTLGALDNMYCAGVDGSLRVMAQAVADNANSYSAFILAYDLNGEGASEDA